MKVQALGHVVLAVRDRQRSEAFYSGVLGFPIAARFDELDMTFFSFGNHHDFAIMAVGQEAKGPAKGAVGLNHVGFKIGEDVDELRKAKAALEAAGLAVVTRDHGVSQSIYFRDPDGNQLEFYVDVSDAWKQDPSAVARSDPLEL